MEDSNNHDGYPDLLSYLLPRTAGLPGSHTKLLSDIRHAAGGPTLRSALQVSSAGRQSEPALLDICLYAPQGDYNVTYNIDAADKRTMISVRAQFRVDNCSVEEGEWYTLTIPEVLACKANMEYEESASIWAGGADCSNQCEWLALSKASATFMQLPNGEFSDDSFSFDLMEADKQPGKEYECMQRSEDTLRELFRTISNEVDSRYVSTQEQIPVIGSYNTDEDGNVTKDLPYELDATYQAELQPGGALLGLQSRFFVPNAGTYETLNGIAYDVDGAEIVDEYFTTTGQLLLRYSSRCTEIPMTNSSPPKEAQLQ
eukprot:gene28429-31572_t